MPTSKQLSGWIATGAGLAVVLLANSISNYVYVAGRGSVAQLRHEMAAQAAALQRQAKRGDASLQALLQESIRNSAGELAWIRVSSADGSEIAGAGLETPGAFPVGFLELQFRNRRAAYKTLAAAGRNVMVEAFPFMQPVRIAGTRPLALPNDTRAAFIEVAQYMDHDDPGLRTLRWNLILNVVLASVMLLLFAIPFLRSRLANL